MSPTGGSRRGPGRPPGDAASGTREALLRAGRELFAAHGYEGVSVRAVAETAGANAAMVHHHFGSKSGLFEEVLRRRFEPLNQRRIEMLDAAIARHAPDDPPLEEVMEAFLRAPVEAFGTPARATLLAVVHSVHEGQLSPEIFEKLFSRLQRHFAKIRDYLEPMSDAELQGRIRFVIGGMIHLLADRMWTGTSLDSEVILKMLIQWGVAVLRAPVTCQPELATEQVR